MPVKTLIIDGKPVGARQEESILQAAQEIGISIPTLCDLEGISAVGACRLCLVEIEGSTKLQPACITKVTEGMVVRTDTPKLQEYRRMIVEMFFAEGNHICSVCVANGNCELQDMAVDLGMDHVRFAYLSPQRAVDISHHRFGMDPNRCILCTRCVRVCDELEGVHTWDIAGRGIHSQVIADLAEPWGDSSTCTSCGKCVEACPTGAIFHKGSAVGEMVHDRSRIDFIATAREKKQWIF